MIEQGNSRRWQESVSMSWSAHYAQRVCADLELVVPGTLAPEAINRVLSSLGEELGKVRRCYALAEPPAESARLQYEVRWEEFRQSSITQMCELPDGSVLIASRHGRIGRYDVASNSIRLVGTGIGNISCMTVVPDGRVLVGTDCGRAFTLHENANGYDCAFFSWSGVELGPIISIHALPDGRQLVLAREGLFEWSDNDVKRGPRCLAQLTPNPKRASFSSAHAYVLQHDGAVSLIQLDGRSKEVVIEPQMADPDCARICLDERGNILTTSLGGAFKVWSPVQALGVMRRVETSGILSHSASHVQPLAGGGFFLCAGEDRFTYRNVSGVWTMQAVLECPLQRVAPHLISVGDGPRLLLRSGHLLTVAASLAGDHYSVLCVFDGVPTPRPQRI